MPSNRGPSKKQRALEKLYQAQFLQREALTLLGGRVRRKPATLPYPRVFTACRELETSIWRLHLAIDSLLLDTASAPPGLDNYAQPD